MSAGDKIQFIDNGNAPEFFANGFHDLEVMGSVTRFVLFVVKRTTKGVFYREPPFTCVMPNDAIGPGIALMIKRAGASITFPVGIATARQLLH